MQEEVENRTVNLAITTTKLTIFIHQGVRKAVFVIACPHGQRSNIARIVLDHPVHRFGIASDSGGDHRIRNQ